MTHDPKNALTDVQALIRAAEKKAGRAEGSVTLIAVSKVHGAETIRPVLETGHVDYGENRVQEAAAKWPALRAEFPAAKLHLIGPLQTNKVKDAFELFDSIHSLDREKLAAKLADAAQSAGHCPDLFVQVNTGEEPQKAGIVPSDADAFIKTCRETYDLPVMGLMCIPPANQTAPPHFALLEKIAKRNGLTGLSMGMTSDFESAVKFGATHVRVGTAIFGHRPAKTER